jgi:predicted flap endonuclease-1-like 5' DNA nuclease
LLRLLLGGAAIGFIWELLNINARAKWIYTVPFLEDARFFEMPLPGFFGFPPFAVECFILWQAIVLNGLAVPRMGITYRARKRKRILAGAAALGFSVIALLGMEAMTVDSRRPSFEQFSDLPAAELRAHGYDMFKLANASPAYIAEVGKTTVETAAAWIETARLATLRGIGAANVHALRELGVTSVADLAAADWRVLDEQLEDYTGREIVDARVRVWIRGARRVTENS